MAVATALFAASALFLPLGANYAITTPFPDFEAVARRLDEDMARDHAALGPQCRDATVRVRPLGHYPVDPMSVAFSALLENRRYVVAPTIIFETGPETARATVARSDLVKIPDAEQRKPRFGIPIFAFVETVADEMKASGLWTQITMPHAIDGNSTLFVRRTCRRANSAARAPTRSPRQTTP